MGEGWLSELGSAAARWDSTPYRWYLAIRNMRNELAKLLFKWLPKVRPCGCGQRAIGEAVVSAVEGNDPGPAGMDGGSLKSGFNGFRPAICKDDTGIRL